jgi:tRNA(fMet)-specific endonuclease VapC
MRFLLDTNLFIATIVHDKRDVARRLRIHRHEVGLSAIVLHELYFGAFKSDRPERSIPVVEAIGLPLIPFEAEDARRAGEVRASLARAGTPIGPYDVLIAGQALARGLTVVTANVGEFRRVDGLAVEDWSY